MSDAAYAQTLIKEAFPESEYGRAKTAIARAYEYLRRECIKPMTARRARALWNGEARRFDSEERDALKRLIQDKRAAKRLRDLEEAIRERDQLRERLARLNNALAVVDADFHRPQTEQIREQMRGQGGTVRGTCGLDSSRTDKTEG